MTDTAPSAPISKCLLCTKNQASIPGNERLSPKFGNIAPVNLGEGMFVGMWFLAALMKLKVKTVSFMVSPFRIRLRLWSLDHIRLGLAAFFQFRHECSLGKTPKNKYVQEMTR